MLVRNLGAKRMSEEGVFAELKSLCTAPGYVHAIAFVCYRDNMIAYRDEMKVDDMMKLFNRERLIRTEITTLLGLVVQGNIDHTLPAPDTMQKYIDQTGALMKDMHDAIGRGMLAGLMTGDDGRPDRSALSRGTALREPIFYSGESAYGFQYRDFALPKYHPDDEWLLERKGFGIRDACEVVRAMGEVQNKKVMDARRAMDPLRPDAWTILPGFVQTREELAASSGLSISVVQAVLEAFTCRDRNEQFTSIADFNSVSATPLIPLANGSVLLFQYYSIVEALYESPFYWMGADAAYRATAFANRGNFTEELAATRLAKVFGSANVHRNVDLVLKKNKVGEIDVMVIFGDRLVLVQTKSKRLTLEARRGNDGHIKDDFRKAIQVAYAQGLSCAQHVVANDCVLYDADKNVIALEYPPKEIFVLCVVADHYPALSFQSRQFLKFETTEVIRAPFVMDVFLLDAMTEMLESPLRLLGYINQRVMHIDKLHTTHELTALSYHLKQNMWLDGEMDLVVLGDDIAADLDLAMTVRREGIAGARTPDGILTRFAGTSFERLVQQIEQRADPACIELGFLLLTLGEDTCRAVNSGLATVTNATRSDGKLHDFTVGIGSAGEGITFHCNLGSARRAADQLASHCYRRKYAQKASKWFGLCIDKEANVRFGLALEFPWEQSSTMDADTANMRQGIDARKFADTPQPTTTNKKVGRNDPCPCGSGRKYKKCHLGQ
jgi:Holliday junction resolvase-like predicted endonuclease